MKMVLGALATWVAFASSALAASSAEGLATEVRAALEARDGARLAGLVHTEGMTEEERARHFASLLEPWTEGPLEDVSAAPLDPDARLTRIYQGRRYLPTAEPAGQIRVRMKTGNGATTGGFFYAAVKGEYRLVGFKSEDLGWKGPPDRQIGFTIASFQQSGLRKIRARYNVSGVDLEGACKYASWGFLGQRLDEVSFESEDEAFEGEVVVTEAGKEIARSEKLRGKGPFVYRPPQPRREIP